MNAGMPDAEALRERPKRWCFHNAGKLCYADDVEMIAIVNQKGGVGKTTTTASLAVLLSRQRLRVHVIDADPQASLTSAFGEADSDGRLFAAMGERVALPVVSVTENLTLTPASIDLARGETEWIGEPGREFILANCLEQTKFRDDTVVLIDSPPSLGVLGVNCLVAARRLLVVVQPGGFELRALAHLQQTVALIKQRINPEINIVGAVLTNCRARRAINELVRMELERLYPVLGTVRSDAELLYSTTEGRIQNLRRSKALDDYAGVARALSKELQWAAKSAA